MNKYFLSAFVLLSAISLFAFESTSDGLSVIKSKKGFVFVFNDSTESFVIEIVGKKFVDVEPEELIFSIDGQIVQFTIVPISVFFSQSKKLDTLTQHFEFELDYLARNYKVDLKRINPKINFAKDGRKIFYWELNREVSKSDNSKETVEKQLFATTNTKRYVIMLTSPLTRENDEKKSRKRLVHALVNLNFKENKFDVEKIRELLKTK